MELCNGENRTKINPFTNISFLRVAIILCVISQCLAVLSDKQLCYNNYSEPISLVRTLFTYQSNDRKVMSFNVEDTVEVKVFSKGAGKRTDLWGVEFQPKTLESEDTEESHTLMENELPQDDKTPSLKLINDSTIEESSYGINPDSISPSYEVINDTTVYFESSLSVQPNFVTGIAQATALPNEQASMVSDSEIVREGLSSDKDTFISNKKLQPSTDDTSDELKEIISPIDTQKQTSSETVPLKNPEVESQIIQSVEEETLPEYGEHISSEDKILNENKDEDNSLEKLEPTCILGETEDKACTNDHECKIETTTEFLNQNVRRDREEKSFIIFQLNARINELEKENQLLRAECNNLTYAKGDFENEKDNLFGVIRLNYWKTLMCLCTTLVFSLGYYIKRRVGQLNARINELENENQLLQTECNCVSNALHLREEYCTMSNERHYFNTYELQICLLTLICEYQYLRSLQDEVSHEDSLNLNIIMTAFHELFYACMMVCYEPDERLDRLDRRRQLTRLRRLTRLRLSLRLIIRSRRQRLARHSRQARLASESSLR